MTYYTWLAIPIPTWTRGVFEPSENFKNYCQHPRTGKNADGENYPDKQGSALLEKHWLRSWTHETYLWNDEVKDINPALITSPMNYFNQLKTQKKTALGKNKDNFHFVRNTRKMEQFTNSGARLGYGVRFQVIRREKPREVRILYFNNADSPVFAAGVRRGAQVISVNNVSVAYGDNIKVLSDGLFPTRENQSFQVVFRNIDGKRIAVTLTPRKNVVHPVHIHATFSMGDGIGDGASTKFGYLSFLSFSVLTAEQQLYQAFKQWRDEGIHDLFLDLRYNGGGFLDLSNQLAYMIAGRHTENKVYHRYRINNHPDNPLRARQFDSPFITTTIGLLPHLLKANLPLPTLNLKRVFILSSGKTCSASEALMNGLRGIGVKVILIGTKTCGKPYGFSPQDNCGITYHTIQFQTQNHNFFGDYADGFKPVDKSQDEGKTKVEGCVVREDYRHELGHRDELLFKTALYYRNHNQCPETSSVSVASKQSEPPFTLPSTLSGRRQAGVDGVENGLIVPDGYYGHPGMVDLLPGHKDTIE